MFNILQLRNILLHYNRSAFYHNVYVPGYTGCPESKGPRLTVPFSGEMNSIKSNIP